MNKNINEVVDSLELLKQDLVRIEENRNEAQLFFELLQLKEVVEKYCKSNNLQKRDIALYCDISSTTLTKALNTPEKVSVTTILAICEVIGYKLFIGRGHV